MKATLLWSQMLLGAAALLLMTGGLPYLGVPEVYQSGVMLILGVVVAFLSLVAGLRLLAGHWALALVHFCLPVIAFGVYLDFASERTAQLILSEDGKKHSEISLEEGQKTLPLGFSVSLLDFDIDYYDNAPYRLYERRGDRWEPLAELQRKGESVFHGEEQWDIGNFKSFAETQQGYHYIEGEPLRMILQDVNTVKNYSAVCEIIDKDGAVEQHNIQVNKPLLFNGWQLSLINHAKASSGDKYYVLLQARHAPGRYWAIGGMVALMISIALWAYLPKRKKGEDA